MSFYARLANTAHQSGVTFVAATHEAQDANRAYLRSHGVEPAVVLSLQAAQIPIRGTPTVILAKGNTVVNSWLGQLNDTQEREVLEAVVSVRNDTAR
jgi:hypothetical protein